MLLDVDEMNMISSIRIRLQSRIRNRPVMDFASHDGGGSIEFNDYQQFTFGENLRHVDWSRYLKDSTLYLKNYQKFEKPEFSVSMDISASVKASGKVEDVKRLTAAICLCLLNNNVTVRLNSGGEVIRLAGKSNWERLCLFIEALPAGGKKYLGLANTNFKKQPNSIVISDFIFGQGYDQLKEELDRFHGSSFLINVSNDFDRNPHLRGNLRLYDSNCGMEVEALIDDNAIKSYKRKRNEYYAKLQKYCAKRTWQYKEIFAENQLQKQFRLILHKNFLIL